MPVAGIFWPNIAFASPDMLNAVSPSRTPWTSPRRLVHDLICLIVLHYPRADSTTITAANTHHALIGRFILYPSSAVWAFHLPPAPAVNGTWIQPYELPANAPPANPRANSRACQLLTNSRVSVMTDYPLSTSPRESTEEISNSLYKSSRMESGAPMEDSNTNFKRNACHLQKVIIPNPFHFFSWDSTTQPRTAAARAHGLRDNVSPDIGS
jgi:hypothetical protein